MAVIAYQYRGELVDQVHRGHIAVADHTGKILWKLGDPERLTFARSSAKPLQAIPVAESGALEHYGITPQELAVICSSHNGEPFHVKAVESILRKAGLSPDQLCCGSEYPMYVPAEDALKIAGIPRAPIYCDCSGKHAGMLITARHLGESLENYTALEHPVQQRILSVFAEMCGVETSDVQLAVDGCGVPVHALPLYRLAQGYARMSLPTLFDPTRAAVLRRITSAMTAHPEMVAGTDRICTQLMAAFGDRIFCKSGASAFYAVGIKDKGIGKGKTREDHADTMNQLFAAYARGKDAKELMTILGEAALSDDDKQFAKFADAFEQRYVNQGNNTNRSIEDTLNLGWELLSLLPRTELKRIKPELIEKYMPET